MEGDSLSSCLSICEVIVYMHMAFGEKWEKNFMNEICGMKSSKKQAIVKN